MAATGNISLVFEMARVMLAEARALANAVRDGKRDRFTESFSLQAPFGFHLAPCFLWPLGFG
jgi:hypothetical protein